MHSRTYNKPHFALVNCTAHHRLATDGVLIVASACHGEQIRNVQGMHCHKQFDYMALSLGSAGLTTSVLCNKVTPPGWE